MNVFAGKAPMSRRMILGVVITVGLGLGFIFPALIRFRSPDSDRSAVPPSPREILASQTNAEGGVTVTVMPKDISSSAVLWEFSITLDTHTVALDQDLLTAVTLTDTRGNSYKPLRWEGDPPGGHHREGILEFSPVKPRPRSLRLTISGIGDGAPRVFQWPLP